MSENNLCRQLSQEIIENSIEAEFDAINAVALKAPYCDTISAQKIREI
jgi:hypothetical protein